MNLEVLISDEADMGARYADVLQVTGSVHDPSRDTVDDQGNPVTFTREVVANGWVSATTHYYPPEDYDTNGNLVPGATPRAMTDAEKTTYCTNLLIAQFNLNYPA